MEKNYTTKNAMYGFMQERCNTDRWEKTTLNSLAFLPNDDSELGLDVVVDGERLEVAETGWKTLLERSRLSGFVLPKLDNSFKAELFGKCTGIYGTEQTLRLIRDGKVAAFHSGETGRYVAIPEIDLFKALEEKLQTEMGGVTFSDGYINDEITVATYLAPEKTEELLKEYNELLGYASSAVPAIMIQTSDVGTSAVKISAMIRMPGKTNIRVGSVISMDHRNDASIEKFTEKMDGLFMKFKDSIDLLNKLGQIKLTYPVGAMLNMCAALKTPQRPTTLAAEQFELSCGEDATAFDAYLAMQDILYLMENDTDHLFSRSKVLQTSEDLTRALTMNWKRMDHPATLKK